MSEDLFNFGGTTTQETQETEDNTGGDEKAPEEENNTQYEPLVKLEHVKTESGEENEESLYKHRARLFRFDNSTKEWKERGTGDVKLLQDKNNKKVRVILRQEKTLKVVMNHFVNPEQDLKLNVGSDRSWTWATKDYAEEEPAVWSFALKFKTPEIANEFKAEYDKARKINESLLGSDHGHPSTNQEKEKPKEGDKK